MILILSTKCELYSFHFGVKFERGQAVRVQLCSFVQCLKTGLATIFQDRKMNLAVWASSRLITKHQTSIQLFSFSPDYESTRTEI